MISAALVDRDVAAIDDNAPDTWRVFFRTPHARDQAVSGLQRQFPTLIIEPVDVLDEDWATRSQADLKAIRVGSIVVTPPWDLPQLKLQPTSSQAEESRRAEEDAIARNFSSGEPITIIIQPSIGFGTGHHATTRLCLAHLQRIDLTGRSVIDVGTGSGILAIAANRLGATPVLAIDDDPDALLSARENVELNPGVEVTLGELDVRRAMLRPFDLVMANLTGGLLITASPDLAQLTRSKGRLLLSGFMDSEERDVLAAFPSYTIDRRSQEDEWVCVTLSRPV